MNAPRFAALILLGVLSVASACPQDDAVFHSGVSLVRVDAEVFDSSGGILTDLKQQDFRLLDQGSEEPIAGFSFEQEPLDLILLFDVAGSMRKKLLQVVRAVELGFHELRRGDRACVMAFGSNTSEVAPFTGDLDAVNQAIVLQLPRLHFGGSSSLVRAASDAALRFRREPRSQRRRAVLAITDEPESDSGAVAVRDLWQSDAVLSELVLGRSPETRVLEHGASLIATRTGGVTVVAGDPGGAFQQAISLLRRRYTLYYAVPAATPGSERSIEVQLSPEAQRRFPGARVRARTGYVVPAQ